MVNIMSRFNAQMSATDPITNAPTLPAILLQRAEGSPDRTAYTFLIDGDRNQVTLTYGQLANRARAVAALLQGHGLTEERVLLLYPPGLEFITALFGCFLAGATAVPTYPPRPNQSLSQIRAIVTSAEARGALTIGETLLAMEQQSAGEHWFRGVKWLASDIEPVRGDWVDPGIKSETLAFLQYTSGSTGTPKGVMICHANLIHNMALIRQVTEISSDQTRLVSWLPVYHDMGLVTGILQPIYDGFQVTLMSHLAFLQQPVRWLRAISDVRATHSGGPNFAYELCLSRISPEQRETLDLSSWQVAFNGAESVRADTLDRFEDAFAMSGFRREAFMPCYGLAEATVGVCWSRKAESPRLCTVNAKVLPEHRVEISDQGDKTLVGCGSAPDSHRIIIVDPNDRTTCPPGSVGEIWVAGPSVARGYFKQPEETEHTFRARLTSGGDSGRFLRTGDMGFLERGELFVTGRIKDMIISCGRNYYAEDIERTAENSNDALRSGCGAAFSVDDGQERLVVVYEVERQAMRDLDVDQVTGDIRQAVAREHQLQVYAVQLIKPASILKTTSGKIQRHACRRAFLDGTLRKIPAVQDS